MSNTQVGNLRCLSCFTAIPTPYHYIPCGDLRCAPAGQREQSEIGLYYYGARWYDTATARFAQADTIVPGVGNPQAWDRYAYTYNTPLKYIDPTGHIACWDENASDPACRNTTPTPLPTLTPTLNDPTDIPNPTPTSTLTPTFTVTPTFTPTTTPTPFLPNLLPTNKDTNSLQNKINDDLGFDTKELAKDILSEFDLTSIDYDPLSSINADILTPLETIPQISPYIVPIRNVLTFGITMIRIIGKIIPYLVSP